MSTNTLDFKCAIITGGAGGIGRGFAESLLKQGKKVIIAGRTEANLQTTASELGNIPYYVLDIGDVKSVPAFRDRVLKDHPEVDCLINNAGVQYEQDVENFNLEKADQEIDINQRGPMHLAVAFIPHFKTKPHAVIMNVSSNLGFVPVSIVTPVYCATKAFIHFWTINLRTQLKGTSIKVVEIVPPLVGTNILRERTTAPRAITPMKLDDFIAEIAEGWKANKELITAGDGHHFVDQWETEMLPLYKPAHDNYKGSKV